MKYPMRVLIVLVCGLASTDGTVPPAHAATDKWLSIQTKNFVLTGSASEADIRRIGRTLEEFRSAVAMIFPKMESATMSLQIFRERGQ